MTRPTDRPGGRAELSAHRWRTNGDHPDDGDDPTQEGAVVRYFRHPGHYGNATCPVCHQLLHLHGWIDEGEDGHTVCPGDWIITAADGSHVPVKDGAMTVLMQELDQRQRGPDRAVELISFAYITQELPHA